MKTKFDNIIVHYDEIGIKGKNRSRFENLLMDSIKRKLGPAIKSAQREQGQITLILSKKYSQELGAILSKIPGIAYFSPAKKCSLDFEKLKKETVKYASGLDFSTFKIDTHRHNKNYPVKSMQVNALLGEAVINFRKKKVKMLNPDLALKVEISDKAAYLSHESVQGVGGLPTDPKQKVVALLSGGFDSPVAAYMMMKRGCQVIFVHFQNKNQETSAVRSKIVDIAKQLSKFQLKTKIYIVPFEGIQKQIIMKSRAETRMLVYRRFMLRIASKIAEFEKAKFLVTGDSLSQVASQTIENLEATYMVSAKHVFSPLIGMNKREIIDISKRIETYELSAQPYGDCCSYFLPKHPVTRANIAELEKIESEFNIDVLIRDALNNSKTSTF